MLETKKIFEDIQLRKLCINQGEYGANKPALPYDPNLPRYIRISDIDEQGRLITTNIASIKEQDAKVYLITNGDLLLARTGSVGKSYLYDERDGKCAHAGYLIKFKLDPTKCYFHYVFQWTRSYHFYEQVDKITRQAVQGNINAFEYGLFLVPYPSIEEQRAIAHILDTLDEAIQKTELLIAKLKAIKQGLLHDLLTRGLDENGQLRDPIAHPEQFKDSPLGQIPKEWEVLSIRDISWVKGGKRLPKSHLYSTTPMIYRYLRVQDFFDKEVDYNSLESLQPATYEILKQYEITKDDLYISIAGSIGYAGVCRPLPNQKIILTENAARIVIIEGMNPQYLATQINSDLVQNQIKKEIGTGGGVPKLALHRVERLKILKPSQEEQNRIVDYSMEIINNIKMEESYLSKLRHLKKGLMHDLLTGKVRVKIPSEETKNEDCHDS